MAAFPDVDLTQLPKTFEAKVPEKYRDVMGHMNIGWFTHYNSDAMIGLFAQLGYRVEDIKENQVGRFALETHMRCMREVRIGDEIEIYSRFLARNEKRFHVINFLLNKTTGEIASTYEIVGMSVDLRLRKSTTLPPDLCVNIDKIIEEHKQLDWDPPLCGVMGPR